jgi:hypothetical protein
LLSRPGSTIALVGVLLGLCGCRSMSPVRDPVESGGGTVEIRITPPRTLDVRNPNGSRTSLDSVSRVRGEPVNLRGDSVTFRIDSWRGSSRIDGIEGVGETVFSRSDPEVSFFRNRVSVKKNLALVAVIGGLVALSIGQAQVGY